MTRCGLRLLGGFDLLAEDGGSLALSTRKDRLLLAYLALADGKPRPRDKVAGMLWADRSETQARDSLRQSLAAIRGAFRRVDLDPLRTERDTVGLDCVAIEVDAVRFSELAHADSTFPQAAALYRGDLLDGLEAPGEAFAEWLRAERERLADLAVDLVERISLTSDASQEGPMRLARLLLARDRLREPVYRALMRLLAAKGERADALKLYGECQATLKRDLGIAPDARTEALYRDILTSRPTSAPVRSEGEIQEERPSIAVLPFADLSGDAQIGHLCHGIAEDIITGLGRFRMFFVIDRHSSAAVAEQSADVVEIGKRLGVRHVVQGSLKQVGARVRITVRLVDAASRMQVWADSYDSALAEIMAAPDTITGAIIATLQGRVESSIAEQSRRKPSLAAYECVLKGIKHLRGYAPDDNQRAIELFQRAIDLDPEYALALAYRGFAEIVLHNYDSAPEPVLAQAQARVAAAVQMDKDDGRCHWLLGMVCGYRGDLEAEERHYLHAIARNPNDANALVCYGTVLTARERMEEGIDYIRQGMRLNPYHPDWYWISLGTALYIAERYADALEAFRNRANPGFWLLSRIAACYAQLGRDAEARATAAEVLRLRPDFSIDSLWQAGYKPFHVALIREGLRKAGLPE